MTQDARTKSAPPTERLTFRRPTRLPPLSMRRTPGFAWAFAGAMVALLVAVGAIAVAVVNGHAWVAIPIVLAAVAVVIVLHRWSMKALLAHVRGDLRRQELDPEVHTTGIPLEIRRTTNKRFAVTLTAIFCAALTAALIFANPAFVVLIAFFALPVLGVAWGIAWRRSGQLIATFESTRLILPQVEIPWTNVARIDFGREPRTEIRYLTFRLIEALPPRGWMDRINSNLSRGAADREVTLRLNQVSEDPQLLHEIAEQLWSRRAGGARVAVAHATQLREAVAATRRFGDLPKGERWRQIKVAFWICAIFLFMAHGAIANFYASETWLRVSGWIAAALTGLGLWLLLRGPGLASLRRGGGTFSYFGIFVVVFVLLAAMCWSIIGRSLPDIATQAFGETREMTLTLSKDRHRTSRKCRRLNGTGISRDSAFHYCASATEYAALPKSGPMKLRTRASWFGVHVDRIEPIDPLLTR